MSVRLSSSLAAFFIALIPALGFGQTTLTVAAASDLTNLEPALAAAFRKYEPKVEVRFVTAASAMLKQQINSGAPYDVFLSANAEFVDQLASSRKLASESVKSYATGRVGVLWSDKKHHNINDLTQSWVRFVALPNPKLAPYGVAAQQALEHAGIWKQVQPKVVYGETCGKRYSSLKAAMPTQSLPLTPCCKGKIPISYPPIGTGPSSRKAGLWQLAPIK
jgi:molybdate transport system substrate-binding protein